MTLECEGCHYYKMLDSAYGYCVRFPPKAARVQKHFFWWVYSCGYPVTPFDSITCGEYKPKSREDRR